MKKQYIPPMSTFLCFAAVNDIASVAPVDLLNGSNGLGTAVTTSTTDIRIEINL